jgi:hypothetical protein
MFVGTPMELEYRELATYPNGSRDLVEQFLKGETPKGMLP